MFDETYEVQIKPLGDSALIVKLDDQVNPTVHKKVLSLKNIVESDPFAGFMEAVPAYNNITIFYHPLKVHEVYKPMDGIFKAVSTIMKQYIEKISGEVTIEQRQIDIPVLYGGEFGPDLEYVAAINHITPEEVIEIHSQRDYLVYMIGFAPGFPYLGGMDERIAAPRKESPRSAIPSGSVGIAGKQTGIYPIEIPGGWQIIGRTPLELFLPEASPPSLLQSGDILRFVPITFEQYMEYKEGIDDVHPSD